MIATETFTAEYRYGVDGFTEVVAGEYVAPDHELIRRYPRNFRSGSTSLGRSEVWRAAAGRTRRASGVPELRHTARFGVSFSIGARLAIDSILGWSDDGRETGGTLLGNVTGVGVQVLDAGGPELAERGHDWIAFDNDSHVGLERKWDDERFRLCGGFHTHPSGVARPSDEDLVAWKERLAATRGGVYGGVYVGLIIPAVDEWGSGGPDSWRAWTTSTDEGRVVCEPATLRFEWTREETAWRQL